MKSAMDIHSHASICSAEERLSGRDAQVAACRLVTTSLRPAAIGIRSAGLHIRHGCESDATIEDPGPETAAIAQLHLEETNFGQLQTS